MRTFIHQPGGKERQKRAIKIQSQTYEIYKQTQQDSAQFQGTGTKS